MIDVKASDAQFQAFARKAKRLMWQEILEAVFAACMTAFGLWKGDPYTLAVGALCAVVFLMTVTDRLRYELEYFAHANTQFLTKLMEQNTWLMNETQRQNQ